MNTFVKAVIILLLIVGIFGGAAWYGYELYLKPQKIVKKAAETSRVAATPAPDRSAPEFARITATTPTLETKAALEKFLTDYPSSPKAPEARALLGDLNVEEFFSRKPGPNKIEYVVVPGDSLARIASKNKVSFDLIIRANQIDRLLIHPGDKFIIPTGDFALAISSGGKIITLRDGGRFFKEYNALQPQLSPGLTLDEAFVTEKIAWHDGNRIAFGDKNYVGSTRWIGLAPGGLTLFSVVEDGSLADVETPVSGIRLSPQDIEEIFALVNRGTPVKVLP